jgi:hypothetical protein
MRQTQYGVNLRVAAFRAFDDLTKDRRSLTDHRVDDRLPGFGLGHEPENLICLPDEAKALAQWISLETS